MNLSSRSVAVVLLAFTFACSGGLRAAELPAVTGRALLKRYADAVVSVDLVVTIKMTMGERSVPPRESKIDVNGTMIAANGLTVTALSAIDPRASFEAMRAMQGANGQKMELGETEFKEVKLRLANGTEIPAVVVLKDADLDLAFVAPLSKTGGPMPEFTWVNLEEAATGEVMGDYFSVSRASKNLQRAPLVRVTMVNGIVEKPRRLFLLTEQSTGTPVFDASGRVLGVTTQYLSNGRLSGLVTLPANDVSEIAKQAAAIKPDSLKLSESESTEATATATPVP